MAVQESILPAVALPSCLIGCAVAAYNAYKIASTPIEPSNENAENSALVNSNNESEGPEMYERVRRISGFISEGANAFLFAEYRVLSIFVIAFGIFLFSALAIGAESHKYSTAAFATIAFLLGAITSTISGFIGMRIAVTANSRVAIAAKFGYRAAFNTSFQAGMVMGFGLSAIGLLVLLATVYSFRFYYSDWNKEADACRRLFEAISGYGLGGSAIALFGRVGGGIYTKAADVGADLSGKVIEDFPEDDPRNPAVIADNVGDNVGDIAGMGADLFGSLAEGSCAAMVLASNTDMNQDWVALNFPILLLSVSLISSWIVSYIATTIKPVDTQPQIEPALKLQLVSSTVLMSVFSAILCYFVLPENIAYTGTLSAWKAFTHIHVLACVLLGLWSGLLIGFITDYYTSFEHDPVKELTQACTTGAATNAIYGLALGYKSTIVPVFALALTIFASFRMAGLFGVAAAALGVLGNIATALTIDAYGPICDNAGGIAEMCHMPSHTRERTDALDAAGNTTAAIGKGSAIASAILVALALFGAFISTSKAATAAEQVSINLLEPKALAGLLVGAMLPYWFCAMAMKAVGDAAMEMVKEVQRQLDSSSESGILIRQHKMDPNYSKCIEISTRAALREMIGPGALVLLAPIIAGFGFGRIALAGLLIGNLVSGTQMAISQSNSGGAWDNAKKLLTKLGIDKKSEQFKAAVIGDTIGDPLKDTSGPSVNILIKLTAILSVVLAPSFPVKSLFDRVLDALHI